MIAEEECMIRVRFAVLFLLVPFWIAAESCGRLASLVGEVTVVRNGGTVDAGKVIDGASVEGFDTIITGQSGAADIILASSSGFSGLLHLEPKTVLVVTVSPSPSTLQIDLLSGSFTAKLQKTQNGSCFIDTGFGVVSGGSGTLVVALNPWGSALIASESGSFLVTGLTEAVMTEPGTVVELSGTQAFPHTMSINLATLASYLASWMEQKRQEAEAYPEKLFWGEARRYQLQLGAFQRAWERWQREKDDGAGPLKSVAIGLRRAERPLARSFYRIAAQQSWLDQGKLNPNQELTRNYTTAQFFQQWDSDFALWMPRLEKARELYRIVAQANAGQFPPDGPDLNVTWASSYFY